MAECMTPAPRKRGRPTLPAGERRVPVLLKLPPAALERLRALAAARGESQADVVAGLVMKSRA